VPGCFLFMRGVLNHAETAGATVAQPERSDADDLGVSVSP
jgi:hypothetical protein